MVQMTKIVKRPGHHIMVYSPPKAGKTLMIGKLAEAGFFLDFVDLENSSQTLFAKGLLSEEAKSRINLIRIPDTPTWPVAIETVMKITSFPKLKILKICEEHGKIDCPACTKTENAVFSEINFGTYTEKHILVVDSLNQLGVSSMAQITKNISDPDFKPGWDEFNAQGRHLDRVLSPIQNCAFNVICTTHEIVTEVNDLKVEEKKNEKVFPLVGTRNYSRNVAKYFDEIVNMEIFNRRHKATTSTVAKPFTLTGSRSNVFLETLQEPSLLPIFDPNWKSTNPSQQEEAKVLLTGVKK